MTDSNQDEEQAGKEPAQKIERIPLEKIDTEVSAPLQLREQLSQDTLERMRATLQGGGSTPPITAVECTIAEDAESGQKRAWPVQKTDPKDNIRYLLADGWHRTVIVDELDAQDALKSPTIRANVIRGADDPWKTAMEIAIKNNAKPGTPLTDSERQKALFRLRELHPKWSLRQLGREVGYTHTQVRRLFNQQEVREVLEAGGTYVPSNVHLEALHDADRRTWRDLARVIRAEKWSPADLELAIKRARAISERDWSDLDAHDPEAGAKAKRDWNNVVDGDVTRIRLAHAANRNGWSDEALLRSAHYLESLYPENARDREQRQEYRAMLRGEMPPSFWMKDEAEPAPASSVNTGGVTAEPAPVAEPMAPAAPATVVAEPEAPVVTSSVPTDSGPEGVEAEAEPKEEESTERAEAEIVRACHQAMMDINDSTLVIKHNVGVFREYASADDLEELRTMGAELIELADALSLVKMPADKTEDAIDAQIARERAEKARSWRAAQS